MKQNLHPPATPLEMLSLFLPAGLTRTDDLWVMSPTSYQLLHSAMLCFDYECKGTTFFFNSKYFSSIFSI